MTSPYGYPGAAYPGPREHPDGGTVLVLGILSLVVCGLIGPFAWSKGNKVLREIDAHPDAYTNRSSVNAGRVCGMVASILLVVYGAFMALVLILALAGASTSGTAS